MIFEMTSDNDNAKILVVDDEQPNLRFMSALMLASGYKVDTASNGIEAIRKAKEISPDIILLDVMMPEMNGMEACRIIKNDPETQHIPVIILTAHADKETKIQCLDAGANDFLSKPIDQIELVLRLRNLQQLKKMEDIKMRNELLKSNQDALERKNRELEDALNDLKTAQSRIIQQEKMASIGQLAAGIAHEINNPIGFIMSNLNTLQKYSMRMSEFMNDLLSSVEGMSGCETDSKAMLNRIAEQRRSLKLDYIIDDIGNLIKESLDGADRMKHIVQDLKSFSRADATEHKLADINKGIDSTINIVWNELKYKTTLKKKYGDIPMTKCNLGQLNQVFMNLLVNAAQAIEKQGEITLKTWHDNGFIYVSISDTGSGIPEDRINRIFEPFFTTKEVGKGTGLGLSIAYDIVKKHKGEIIVESAVGKGTTFIIKIPVVE
ncbi:MAG: response regulator [Nitrospirae bacterium]|nr:response regulator [Nitrospirota bacterium]